MTRSNQVLRLALGGNLGVSLANLRFRKDNLNHRRLLRRPSFDPLRSWSPRRINALLQEFRDITRYLEIGVFKGKTLENIQATYRTAVDPSPIFSLEDLPEGLEIFVEPSDDFFARHLPEEKYNVIFVDGLHTFEQTYQDVLNSVNHLSPDGAVLIDDTVPRDQISAMRSQSDSLKMRKQMALERSPWHGDFWKVVTAIDQLHPELDFRTIVGSGNPQTLVWRHDVTTVDLRAAPIAEFSELDFAEEFSSGIPPYFRCSLEADALDSWRLFRACAFSVHLGD